MLNQEPGTARQSGNNTITCRRRQGGAFTLVELLTCIAITGFLVAMALGVGSRMRQSAQGTRCLTHIRQIGMATLMYADENQGRFPESWSLTNKVVWNDRLNVYLGMPAYSPNNSMTRYWHSKLWWCPAATLLNGDRNNRHYGINSMMASTNWNYRRMAVSEPSRIIMIGEINKNGDLVAGNSTSIDHTGKKESSYRISHGKGTGSNYCFCDGHVEHRTGVLDDLNASTSPWKWW